MELQPERILVINMIRSYKLHVDRNEFRSAFLEYGETDAPVSFDQVKVAVVETGITEFNEDAVRHALDSGSYTVIILSAQLPQNLSARCWVNSSDGLSVTAYLTSPVGNADVISESDLRHEIKLAGFGNFYILDDSLSLNLQAYYTGKNYTEFKVAEKREAVVKVEISDDSRTAFLDYSPAFGGNELTVESVISQINSQKVVFGIDQERLAEILKAGIEVKRECIARAKEPVEGQPASLKYLFDAYGEKIGPKIKKGDFADFRDLGMNEDVEVGVPLVEKIPATQGEEGIDVMGRPLKVRPGKDIRLPKGKGTRINEGNQNILEAAIAGIPKLLGARVDVLEVLILNEIDFSTGNIDFIGDVIIKGVVNPGFIVKAAGDITCSDVVEGASIEAGGNVFLKRGIKGQGKSVVRAGHDIVAKFVENSTLIAGNDVIVDEALIHSKTSASESVLVTNAKGSIFGGDVLAGSFIKASFIGSEMFIHTKLEVGFPPHLRDQLFAERKFIKKKKEDRDKTDKNLVVLKKFSESGELSGNKKVLHDILHSLSQQLSDEIELLSASIENLEAKMQKCAEGRVEAVKTIYPGVSITIKNATRIIRAQYHMALFEKEGPDVVLASDLAEATEEDAKKAAVLSEDS